MTRPCWHMKTLLVAQSDGRLWGWLRHYVHAHLAGCRQCQSALEALEEIRERLQRLSAPTGPPLSAERRAALRDAQERLMKP